MWQRLKNWFETISLFEEPPERAHGSQHGAFHYREDDDDDENPSVNAEEARAVAEAELRRIESRITQSEEALYGCQDQMTRVTPKVRALFESLEAILMESYDHGAFSLPVDARGGEGEEDAVRTAQRRELAYERARRSAVKDVTGMVDAILAQRDQLEARLVRLQVNLKALESQRDRVKEALATQREQGVLATGDLIPLRPAVPDMMFEMEIREAQPATGELIIE